MGENIFLALKKQHKKKQKHEAQQGIEMEGKKKKKKQQEIWFLTAKCLLEHL